MNQLEQLLRAIGRALSAIDEFFNDGQYEQDRRNDRMKRMRIGPYAKKDS